MTPKVLLLTALAACAYDARYENCSIHCSDTTGCPEDLTCGPEGLCRASEADACVLSTDGTGGMITHVAGHTIHTFSTMWSGSMFMAPDHVAAIELLVVAGGGGGGSTRGGGGGGGGGVVYTASYALTQTAYVVLVGHGGTSSTNGGNSTFGMITAIGGGAGRPTASPDGGSGGGASHDTNDGPAGLATSGQGNRGGLSGSYDLSSMIFMGAGGGGAGGAGANGAGHAGGAGGPGLGFTISGALTYYGGGGGGGDQDLGVNSLLPGVGGMGGGGDGGLNAIGHDGSAGTGGGGGGGGGRSTEVGEPPFFSGGIGGDGVVIMSYITSW